MDNKTKTIIATIITGTLIAGGIAFFKQNQIRYSSEKPVSFVDLTSKPVDSAEYNTAKTQLIQNYEATKKTGVSINDFFSIIAVLNKENDKLKNMTNGDNLLDKMVQATR